MESLACRSPDAPHSRGVCVFFRVYTPAASDSSVRHLSSGLSPLDSTSAAFTARASRTPNGVRHAPLLNFTPPSELRSPRCPRTWLPAETDNKAIGSSLRILFPTALKDRKCPLHAGLPHPLRSAFAVFHDLNGLLHFRPSRVVLE